MRTAALVTPLLAGGLALACVLSGVAGAAASSTAPAGPDVSSHQHPNGRAIDWQKVRQGGSSFVFVKATEGHTYTNPYFARDFADAQGQGLVRSAYHYARPALPLSTAAQQADYFLSTSGTTAQQGDLPATLDLEESGGLGSADLAAWAKAWLHRVASATGRPPIVYTYPYFWRHAMADSRQFTSYPLWIADYSHSSAPGPLPGGWTTWSFWQTTASGRQPGIGTAVDLNRFNGDDAALQRLASPPAPSPTPGALLPILPSAVPSRLPTLSPVAPGR